MFVEPLKHLEMLVWFGVVKKISLSALWLVNIEFGFALMHFGPELAIANTGKHLVGFLGLPE